MCRCIEVRFKGFVPPCRRLGAEEVNLRHIRTAKEWRRIRIATNGSHRSRYGQAGDGGTVLQCILIDGSHRIVVGTVADAGSNHCCSGNIGGVADELSGAGSFNDCILQPVHSNVVVQAGGDGIGIIPCWVSRLICLQHRVVLRLGHNELGVRIAVELISSISVIPCRRRRGQEDGCRNARTTAERRTYTCHRTGNRHRRQCRAVVECITTNGGQSLRQRQRS